MIARTNENLIAKCFHHEENSFEFEETGFDFKCRVANSKDNEWYQGVSGLMLNDTSMTLFATRLDKPVFVGDKIILLGKEYLVQGVGYYLSQNNQLHAYDLTTEEVFKRSPKGIIIK